MATFKIQILNNIAPTALSQLAGDAYEMGSELTHPDVILLRSANLHEHVFPHNLLAVGRAGAGTNNIPVSALTAQGIPVFNTPGANANAVKELVIAALFLGCRHICQAWSYVQSLTSEGAALATEVEQAKKQFRGFEVAGKTLGVIGLGAIGVEVANAALGLGMQVVGYDPVISVQQAWRLETRVKQAHTLDELLANSDFVTLHIPLTDDTRGLIDANRLQTMKSQAVLINFARDGVIKHDDLVRALAADRLTAYVSDFPHHELKQHPRVISLPHLGASTVQSEENCATMIGQQIRDYLEQGTICHSVNFPAVDMPWKEGYRLAVVNRNIPNMVGQITTLLAQQNMNVIDLINRSRGDIAYTLIDVDREISAELLHALADIDGVVKVRVIA